MNTDLMPVTAAEARATEAADAFIGSIFASALGMDDDFIVGGLDPKNASYVLMMADRHPHLRSTLARARIMRDRKMPNARAAKPTTVYFIRRGARGPIKIGVAFSPSTRLAQLQTACAERLTIIGTRPGGVEEEHRLHSRFASHHIRGEWFSPVPEIIASARELS